MNLKVKHNTMSVQLAYILAGDPENDVIRIGKNLINIGFDEITDGFWIWDIAGGIEYYSPKFISSLGYQKNEFPYTPKSWQDIIFPDDAKKALAMYEKHLNDPTSPYYIKVRYKHKLGDTVTLICAGSIVNRDTLDNLIMLGTHEIL